MSDHLLGQAELRMLKLCFHRDYCNEDQRSERMLIFLLCNKPAKYIKYGPTLGMSLHVFVHPVRWNKTYMGTNLCQQCWARVSGLHYRKEAGVRSWLSDLLKQCGVWGSGVQLFPTPSLHCTATHALAGSHAWSPDAARYRLDTSFFSDLGVGKRGEGDGTKRV